MNKKNIELTNFVTQIKVNETILVDGPAKITLLETNYEGHRNRIKLSIIAPKTTKISKGIIHDKE